MDALEKKMLTTICSNLSHCTDFPDGVDDFDEISYNEIINWIKIIKGSIKDNVNMIRTIIDNNSEKDLKI